jgi:hypothetical protein
MRTVYYGICAAIMTAVLIFGQAPSQRQPKVVTVCEALAYGNRYIDTDVAVVGRMMRSVSLVDRYEFLAQDQCARPVTTHGHIWPNVIQVWVNGEKGMPKPPRNNSALPSDVVAAKLSAVRATTDLGSHEEARLDAHGRPSSVVVPNEWAVVYGRIVKSPRLDEDCGDGSCGGDDVPYMIIADRHEVHLLTNDGKPLPKK